MDRLITQMQETGRCSAVGCTVAELIEVLDPLGIDPRTVYIQHAGELVMVGFGGERDGLLAELDLPSRAYNALMRSGYRTIRQIVKAGPRRWFAIPNFGVKMVEHTLAALRAWDDAILMSLPPERVGEPKHGLDIDAALKASLEGVDASQ